MKRYIIFKNKYNKYCGVDRHTRRHTAYGTDFSAIINTADFCRTHWLISPNGNLYTSGLVAKAFHGELCKTTATIIYEDDVLPTANSHPELFL